MKVTLPSIEIEGGNMDVDELRPRLLEFFEYARKIRCHFPRTFTYLRSIYIPNYSSDKTEDSEELMKMKIETYLFHDEEKRG